MAYRYQSTVSDSEENVSKRRTKMKRNTEMEELTHIMARMAQMMEQNQTQRSTNVPKFRTMGEKEDIEDYLTLFERHMILNDMPEDEWTRQLPPVLTGRAGAAYNNVELKAPYEILKQFSNVMRSTQYKLVCPETFKHE